VHPRGAVYIHDGVIEAVQPEKAAPPAGFGSARRVRTAGLRVCLGSDWTPSGTRNVLGELKIAATWNEQSLGRELTDEDLVEMATANPGDTLARAWGTQVGRLVPGALADVAVFANVDDDPWHTVLHATERHVRLVIVGGRPAYGNHSRLEAAGVADAEPVTVAGVRRGLVMSLPEELLPPEPDLQREATKSWADGLAELAAVWADPAGAVRRARRRRAVGEPTFEFVPDMPSAHGDDTRALDEQELDQLVMPAFDGIGHDTRWINAVRTRAPAHAQILKAAMARF
jgi:hypothetical protein